MRIFTLLKITPLFFLLFSYSGQARKIFEAPYVSFNIGENWTCKSFGIHWVCHHRLQKGAKPALILVSAKEGKSTDNTDMYKQAFKVMQTSSSKSHIKKITIHQQKWMESFSKNSLSKNIFSRLLGTVCCDNFSEKIHVFIGFHAHQENYAKYANQFLMSVRSLRLSNRLKETIDQIRRQTDQQTQDMMSYLEKILYETETESDMPPQKNTRGNFLLNILIFAVLAGFGFFLFLYYRKKRKQKRERIRAEKERRRRRKRRSSKSKPSK